MSTTEQAKEIKVEIRLPSGGYPKTMFFNRLRVDQEEGFHTVHFGLVSSSALLDSYRCVLPERTLVQNQKALIDYLNRIGHPEPKAIQSWAGDPARAKADVVDIISMAFRDSMAETCFCVFPLTAAARARRVTANSFVEAQPLALLRSSVEMQKQLIEALYE